MKTTDLIASIGVTILLIAFLLNLFKKLSAESTLYGLLNFIGAAICGIASYLVEFYPFVVLEGVWAVFGLIALFRNRKRTAG